MKSINLFLFLTLLILSNCKKANTDYLSVSTDKIEITGKSEIVSFTLKTNARSWSIENSAHWLLLSTTSGIQKEAQINIRVDSNTLAPRQTTLTLTAGNASPVLVVVSQAPSAYLYQLTCDKSDISLEKIAGSNSFAITSDAPVWQLSTESEWIQFDRETGTSGTSNILFTVTENTGIERRATLLLSAEHAKSIQITVTQKGNLYPDYNTNPIPADGTGMISATEIASKIKLGWNIGNTLEAIGGETNWGNPEITEAYIKFVKASGFNAIRLPCSWNQYSNQLTAEIQESWLKRVKEVVQYCVKNDMYVILNIHWDGGWLENNCTTGKQEENNAKQKAFWEQIATHLRDFDGHLIFASANEPNVEDATKMQVLMSYHQTFIDAVRSTGGKNANRVLLIQGPSTDIPTTNKLMTTMPTDILQNRLMVEIHYYTPWNFTGMQKDESWGNMFYYWGKDYHSVTDPAHNPTWGEEATVDEQMALMKTQFVDKGIPVVMGEYGCGIRTNLTGDALALHKASRAYYFKYITKQAKANGILPFFWDTGGMLDRNNNTILDKQGLDGILQGSN